jgi:SAM-dependent methyltransferase
MRLGAVPQNFVELLGLAAGVVPTPLMDTVVALLLARTIMAATALGIFDALENGALTAEAISVRCGTNPSATDRLLRALYGCRYLEWAQDHYRLAPVARRWLLRRQPQSLHAAILHRSLDLRFMMFEDYVKDGKTQDFHGKLSPQEWQVYHDGQASHATLLIEEVVKRVRLPEGATDLLDLGGGHGAYSVAFCRRYPTLRARVLDLARTEGLSEPTLASNADRSRVKFEIADIRTVPIPENSCDVILMANVVHHFDEAINRRLMRTVARALRAGGALIVIDFVRPRALARLGQLEGLLDLYFGAASGAGLWTIEDIRKWVSDAGNLELLPPKTMRRMPYCKMQVARSVKPDRMSPPPALDCGGT